MDVCVRVRPVTSDTDEDVVAFLVFLFLTKYIPCDDYFVWPAGTG